MRLTLVAGVLAGLGVWARFAPANELRSTAKGVAELARRFRSGADARGFDHGGTSFSRMLTLRGQEFLGQSFEVDHDFYRAAVAVGGVEGLGPVARLAAPLPGDLTAASPWVTIERESAAAVEKQTVAVGFRKIKELGRDEALRLVRVQREYQLIGLGPFVRVKAVGTDDIQALGVQVGEVTGTFTGFSLMLGQVLSFRATPTHLYVYTSANAGYEVALTVIDGRLHFSASRQMLSEVGAMVRAQEQKVPAAVCQGQLAVDAN